MKNFNFFGHLSFAVLLIVCAGGCKNEKLPEPKMSYDQALLKSNNVMQLMSGEAPPPLDWENISFMPSPPNVDPIPVPWQSGLGGRKIDDDIINDYKSQDGWEMVYNTFNTTQVYNPSYFMLYNKYKGLLRTYFYFVTPSAYPSSNISYLLTLRGVRATQSPMLNFAAKDLIRVDSNTTDVSQIQPYMVSNTGSWYATDFELAYDPNITTTNYTDLQLNWSINPNTISQITLNGIQTGTISGTVTQTKPGTNFFGGLVNAAVDGAIKLGKDGLDSNFPFLAAPVASSVVTAATNAASGLVKGFLNGIIGGATSTTTKQQIDLKINSKISVTGTSTTQTNLFDNVFALPGTLNSRENVPFYPNYESPMGLYYLSGVPTITYTDLSYNVDVPATSTGVRTKSTFTVDQNSFQLLFNPSLTSIATIQNIKKEVLYLPNASQLNKVSAEDSNFTNENVAGKDILGNVKYITVKASSSSIYYSNRIVLRVSFDVVPNNGSPTVKIVKTFRTNLVKN